MFKADDLGKAATSVFGVGEAIHRTPCLLKAVYDFSVLGGATGDIALLDDLGQPAVLPKNAIVRRVLAHVATAVTSGGSATVALKAVNSADLMSATAKASLTAAALVDGVPVGSAATAVGPLAADTPVKVTVGTAALTAGKIYFFIDYQLSN